MIPQGLAPLSPDVEQQAGMVPPTIPAENFAPGIYDMPEHEYHADPVPGGSLSSTEIKRLLDSPARYRHAKDHGGSEHKDVFDFGKAAHSLVLGAGGEMVVLDFDNFLTKAAKEARDEARANGATPILRGDWLTVEAMAAALRAHPIAAALLDPDKGKPEQSLFWQQGGIWRRARYDWLPTEYKGRLILPDYKTTPDASAAAFSKSVANFGYHNQAGWYLDGAIALLGVRDPAFVFIAQEKIAPYLVNVIELDRYALEIGRSLNEEAVETYLACMESGEWPGYPNDVTQIALPRWAEMSFEETRA